MENTKNDWEHINYCLNVGKTFKERLMEIRTSKEMSVVFKTEKNIQRSILLNPDLKEKVLETLDDFYFNKLLEIREELKKWISNIHKNDEYLNDEQKEIYDYIINF